jgi:hypothetical protein
VPLANTALVKLYNDIKKLINNMATQITRDFNLKLTNLRIGEENIAANAVTSRTVAAEAIAGRHIRAQSIGSEHLKIEVVNSLSYPNRNYIRFCDKNVLSSEYLIAEYDTSELIYDMDYTIVVYGLVNDGQQIVAAFNDGADMSDPVSFEDGYAILHVHTPEVLLDGTVQFYNYPEETATIASIGWVCMYRGNLSSPSMELNLAPEDLGQKVSEATTTVELLGGEINAKVSKGELSEVLRWEAGQGIILGRVSNDPEETAVDMQLQNSVMNIRRNGIPVVWFGIGGMNIAEGRVDGSLSIGLYKLRRTSDGGLGFGIG